MPRRPVVLACAAVNAVALDGVNWPTWC